MRQKISLRLRVTLVCGVVLAVCCLLLTLSHNHYAYKMADAIEAIPLQPAQAAGTAGNSAMEALSVAQAALPARETFRTKSLMAMGIIILSGCLMVYWLTGKALSPLRRLERQIRSRTAADLDRPLPVPTSGDEVAGLAVSFNQMSQNLSKVFAQQKQFAQCAAHELRTPLSVLKTRMALFRKKGLCSSPETSDLLDVLEEQTHRLSALVSDLLALTNMDGVDCSEIVDVPSLLAQAAESLTELAQEHGVSLRLQTVPGKVSGNRVLLERAFFNLIENAIKYNRPNGTVTIQTAQQARGMLVEVSDSGIGIPQECLEQIFDPFFRVDPSRSRQFGGAGLGLSLVRAVADAHGGSIRAEALPGHGSRFVMMLPCQQGN